MPISLTKIYKFLKGNNIQSKKHIKPKSNVKNKINKMQMHSIHTVNKMRNKKLLIKFINGSFGQLWWYFFLVK